MSESALCLHFKNTISFRFHNDGSGSYPVCRGKQLTCSNNILNRIGEFNHVQDISSENKTKICLSNCEDQTNEYFVTSSNYPNKKARFMAVTFAGNFLNSRFKSKAESLTVVKNHKENTL